MKKKLFSLMIMAAAIILSVTSCKDDNYEEATLEVTPSTITFTTDGGAQKLVVTTNRSKWVATSPQSGDWITLATNGDQLTVTASANTGAARNGYILLNAGDAAATVTFSQAAGSGGSVSEFNITPENASLNLRGGDVRFDVIGTTDYTATTTTEWLTVTKTEGASFFTVTAAEYNETGTREGKVNIQAGSLIKEVTITQQGKLGLILPYLGKSFKWYDVAEFEAARGSHLLVSLNATRYPYATASDRIPQINYIIGTGSILRPYTEANAFCSEITLGQSDELKELLAQNHFTLFNVNANQTSFFYTNDTYPYTATVTCGESAGGTLITFNYSPVQTETYPTFTELPMTDKISWIGNATALMHGKPITEVLAYEREQGSTMGEETKTATNWYVPFTTVSNSRLDPFVRSYWLVHAEGEYNGEVRTIREVYNDFTVAFFRDGNSFYMTKEFTKLLSDKEYNYVGSSGAYRFYRSSNQQIVVGAGSWDDDHPAAADFQRTCTGAPASGSLLRIVTKEHNGIKYYDVELNEEFTKGFDLRLK